MIATQQIAGNNSGPFLRKPKIVVMHATRSGQGWTDAEELGATLNWFVNPNGASSHWVLSEVERVRVVSDALIAWHSAYLNGRSWGIELTQPTNEDFTGGHYANAALVGQNYVKLGVAPVWLDYWDGDVSASGFVDHEDTKQGREAGKTDPGPKFDRVRFIASLEDDMPLDELKVWMDGQMKGHANYAEKRRNAWGRKILDELGAKIAAIPSGSGLTADQAHAIAKDEIDLAKVKAAR